MQPLNHYAVLSPSEVEAIHEASLELLERVGLEVLSPAARDVLAGGGARVEAHRVRFPRSLVEACLARVPATITLYDRTGRPAVTLGGERTVVASGHNATFVLDPGGTRRPATCRDVAEFARVADALPNLPVVAIEAMPQDVPPATSLVHAYRHAVANTTKPIYWSTESLRVTVAILEMMEIASGWTQDERPTGVCQLSPTSPFYWEHGAADAVIAVAQRGVPLSVLPQPMTGVSAPLTLAGTLTVHNAETLSGVVLSQLVRPGTPAIYGAAWTTFDMRRGSALISRPEAALMRIAGAQLARRYAMPSHCIGPDTDAHAHDEQQGWEKMLTLLAAHLGGVNLVVNAGMFATGMTCSLAQLVIDDELAGQCARFRQGIAAGPESIAAEVIAAVGPRGTYLMEPHTLRHLKGDPQAGIAPELRETDLPCAASFETWQSAGAPTVEQTAYARAAAILAAHQPQPLPEDIAAALDRHVRQVEALP